MIVFECIPVFYIFFLFLFFLSDLSKKIKKYFFSLKKCFMEYAFINFILLFIILLIILIVFVFILKYYFCIKSYVDDILHKTDSIIPSLASTDHEDIIYPDKFPNLNNSNNYSNELSLFLTNTIRSAYHISKHKNKLYPNYVNYIRPIGNNGHLVKIIDNKHKYNTYILSYRGTITARDLLTDLDSVQVKFEGINHKLTKLGIMTHRGFTDYWTESTDDITKLIDDKIIKKHDKLIICGHSLGCASASMTALSLASYGSYFNSVDIILYMFAPPRVGNHTFIENINYYIPDNWAIVNSSDLVTELPPVTLPTIGNNWLYDNWKNRIQLDIQLGSIILNHKLNTYMCGLDEDIECPNEPVWQYDKIKIFNSITTII